MDVTYNGPTTRSKGKLKIDNQVLNTEETIEFFPRTKKKSYKEVKYKENVITEEFKEITPEPRQSERLLGSSWTGSKTRNAMTVNGRRLLPSSVHALPSKGLKIYHWYIIIPFH